MPGSSEYKPAIPPKPSICLHSLQYQTRLGYNEQSSGQQGQHQHSKKMNTIISDDLDNDDKISVTHDSCNTVDNERKHEQDFTTKSVADKPHDVAKEDTDKKANSLDNNCERSRFRQQQVSSQSLFERFVKETISVKSVGNDYFRKLPPQFTHENTQFSRIHQNKRSSNYNTDKYQGRKLF